MTLSADPPHVTSTTSSRGNPALDGAVTPVTMTAIDAAVTPDVVGFRRLHPRRLGRRGRIVVAVLMVITLVVAVLAGYGVWAKWRLDQALNGVRSEPVFASIDPATRPAPSADGGMTFLLAGSDTLQEGPTTGNEASAFLDSPSAEASPGQAAPGRADVIMVVHVNTDRSKASLVSIPRDAYVTIPAYVDAAGVAMPASARKINASFALGGGSLLVRTVEGVTGLRVDHFAYIDYLGIIRLIDALGGVTVDNPYGTSDVYGNPEWDFPASPELELDGFHARVWVSQRKNLPRGDLDRARNSRELFRAIGSKLASPAVLSNPARLQSVIDLTTEVATVDETLDPGTMKGLALSMRGLDLAAVPMRTAPTLGKSTKNYEVVYILDPVNGKCLWSAVGSSDLASVVRCSQA